MNEFVADSSPLPPQKEILPPSAAVAEEPLHYHEAYRYIFRSGDAASNVLLPTLCQFIPIVGPMVIYGYQFEIFDSQLRGQADYPRFDFNRFVDYLKRGVWPFLVYLLLNLFMVPVIVVMNIVLAVGGAALAQSSESGGGDDVLAGVLVIVGFAVFFLVIMALSFGMMFILTPLTIAAGISQDLGAAFRLSWAKSFIGKVWKEQLLSQLFLMFSGMILVMLGMLLCFVGVYPAATILMLAQAHFYFQLYRLFLARGGEPIAPKAA